MVFLNEFFSELSGLLWGWPMIILLLGTHLFLTIRLRFPQRKMWTAIKLSVRKDKGAEGDVSQFAALATALAATIGTGNIIGVATAISLGGPGAVLWCWLTGVFGISTKYAEGLLSIKYRVKTSDGKMLGGPMYALERGLGWKWLAVLFAIFTALASFGIGNTVQANAISTIAYDTYDISPYVSGIVVCGLTAAVVLGGVKSIAKVCSRLVPFMALFYVLGCIYILVMNSTYLWPAIKLIVQSAFSPQAAGGHAPLAQDLQRVIHRRSRTPSRRLPQRQGNHHRRESHPPAAHHQPIQLCRQRRPSERVPEPLPDFRAALRAILDRIRFLLLARARVDVDVFVIVVVKSLRVYV